MTFELSQEDTAARDAARTFARSVEAEAATIDRAAAVPAEMASAAAALLPADALPLAVVVEELAAASAAVALVAASTQPGAGRPLGLAGLRGAPTVPDSPRTQLVLAAIALGIGRRAVDASLGELRQTPTAADEAVEKPHWVVADAATELEGARLLTYDAARRMDPAAIAVARLMASAAATRAVEAALRITGVAGLQEGSTLERLARDVRSVALLLGTEEAQRATAAEGLLPAERRGA